MKTTQTLLGLSLALALASCGNGTPALQTQKEKAWQEVQNPASLAVALRQQLPPRADLLKDSSTVDSTSEVVVSYNAENAAAFESMVQSLGATIKGRLSPAKSSHRFALLVLPADLSASKVSRALSATGQVRYAQMSQKVVRPTVPAAQPTVLKMEQQAVASDPLAIKQWWIKNIKADQVRNIATGKGIVVGVVDDDFNRLHEDLKAEGKIVTGIDAVETSDFSAPVLLQPDQPLTSGSHGSGSAGTIAERMGNGVGGAGVAPDAILMPIRIFSDFGFAGDFNVAAGIIWAVDNGAQVLNNSWGGGGYTQVLKDAVDYALANNVVVVGSAGNDYSDLHNGLSAFTGVISVGASTNTDTKTNFSNIGPRVDLFAPGTDGLTTYGTTNDGYGLFGGTSMAGPVVSGASALLLERAKALGVTLTPYQVKKILVNSTDPMKDQPQGRVNVQKALNFTKDTIPQDGGYLAVRVTGLIDEYGLAGVDVTLVPLEGQNKGQVYVGKTGFGLIRNEGIAIFGGIEPGRYQVNVAGPDIHLMGGQRTALTGNVVVESGVDKAKTLSYAIAADPYEYTKGGMTRNNTFDDALDVTSLPDVLFQEGLVLGGTFDNENYNTMVPFKGPDVDIVKAYVKAGDVFQIAVYASYLDSAAVAQIEVYDPNRTLVATGSPTGVMDSRIEYKAPTTGNYYLKVSNLTKNEGAKSYYGLVVRKVVAPQ